MAQLLTTFLALGSIANGAFTEVAGATGYARAFVFLGLRNAQGERIYAGEFTALATIQGGTAERGSDIRFAPAGADWPAVSAAALFSEAASSNILAWWPLPAPLMATAGKYLTLPAGSIGVTPSSSAPLKVFAKLIPASSNPRQFITTQGDVSVAIFGNPGAGNILTALAVGLVSPQFQWTRDPGSGRVNIAGATGETYTQTPADVGCVIGVAATAGGVTVRA